MSWDQSASRWSLLLLDIEESKQGIILILSATHHSQNTTRSNLGHKANLQGTDDDEEEKESNSQSKYREEGGDELPEDD